MSIKHRGIIKYIDNKDEQLEKKGLKLPTQV